MNIFGALLFGLHPDTRWNEPTSGDSNVAPPFSGASFGMTNPSCVQPLPPFTASSADTSPAPALLAARRSLLDAPSDLACGAARSGARTRAEKAERSQALEQGKYSPLRRADAHQCRVLPTRAAKAGSEAEFHPEPPRWRLVSARPSSDDGDAARRNARGPCIGGPPNASRSPGPETPVAQLGHIETPGSRDHSRVSRPPNSGRIT
jgi:hypothetical protein